jgi:hypothetical protein
MTRWFGSEQASLYDVYQRILGYRLGDELGAMSSPTMICEPAEGGPWAGDAAQLARRVGEMGTLVRGLRADEAVATWLDMLC